MRSPFYLHAFFPFVATLLSNFVEPHGLRIHLLLLLVFSPIQLPRIFGIFFPPTLSPPRSRDNPCLFANPPASGPRPPSKNGRCSSGTPPLFSRPRSAHSMWSQPLPVKFVNGTFPIRSRLFRNPPVATPTLSMIRFSVAGVRPFYGLKRCFFLHLPPRPSSCVRLCVLHFFPFCSSLLPARCLETYRSWASSPWLLLHCPPLLAEFSCPGRSLT